MGLLARAAVVQDAEAMARVYNQGIAEGGATFETEPRTVAQIADWFDGGAPMVVVEEGGLVVAFAAASRWRPAERFRGIAELSVYVAREARGRGAGRAAVDALVVALQAAGFWKVLAGVFAGNAASRRLLLAAGFREVGVFEQQARLQGRWIDVVKFERLFVTRGR